MIWCLFLLIALGVFEGWFFDDDFNFIVGGVLGSIIIGTFLFGGVIWALVCSLAYVTSMMTTKMYFKRVAQ